MFVLLFVFPAFYIAPTNDVICEKLFILLHINVTLDGINYQQGLSCRALLKIYEVSLPTLCFIP